MKNKKDLLIGFIGQGFIGKNMADDFEERGFNVVRYDDDKFYDNRELIPKCDYVFIAVPTPTTPDGFDASIIEDVIDLVGEGNTAIIKSTIKVGTTERLQKQNLDKYILHSPEFLTEKNAKQDTREPKRNIVGYTKMVGAKQKAIEVMELLPDAEHKFIVYAKDAELTKYMGNSFLMLKVVFANIMYDLARENEANYEAISKMVGLDDRIGGGHLAVEHTSGVNGDRGRGAGGHCFIKDTATLVEMIMDCEHSEWKYYALEFMNGAVDLNNYLLRTSNKDLELLNGVYGQE